MADHVIGEGFVLTNNKSVPPCPNCRGQLSYFTGLDPLSPAFEGILFGKKDVPEKTSMVTVALCHGECKQWFEVKNLAEIFPARQPAGFSIGFKAEGDDDGRTKEGRTPASAAGEP